VLILVVLVIVALVALVVWAFPWFDQFVAPQDVTVEDS